MRYMTRDGLQLQGDEPRDIVDALRRSSHTPGRDREHFKGLIARGARLQTGRYVRTDTCDNLLADLVSAGLIESL